MSRVRRTTTLRQRVESTSDRHLDTHVPIARPSAAVRGYSLTRMRLRRVTCDAHLTIVQFANRAVCFVHKYSRLVDCLFIRFKISVR
jgi:hypothetical protein